MPWASMTALVPPQVLLDFFTEATGELNALGVEEVDDDSTTWVTKIRQMILMAQQRCLERLLDQYNHQQISSHKQLTGEVVKRELRSLSRLSRDDTSTNALQVAMDTMNEAARQTLCRLALYSAISCETLSRARQHDPAIWRTRRARPLERTDILEFCGLCTVALRLPNVQRYLTDGSPLFTEFAEHSSSSSIIPHERLENIQHLCFLALGRDPFYSTDEIQRIFFTPKSNKFSTDIDLKHVFGMLLQALRQAHTEATNVATQRVLSDGVTRVVEVSFSEKDLDPCDRLQLADEPPFSQMMEQQMEDQQRDQLRVARQTAALEQEILAELLSMRDEERDGKLAMARSVSESCVQKLAEIPAGSDRIAFLRNIDSRTQRLMAMHKVWENMMSSNGGIPPKLRFSQASQHG